jgi:hypothetical protein
LFSAGATRYAVDAVRVVGVTRTDANGVLALPENVEARDLSSLLGGDPEPETTAAVTIAVTPQVALRVKRVEGVFDVGPAPRWPVSAKLIPLITPAVRRAGIRRAAGVRARRRWRVAWPAEAGEGPRATHA